MRPACTKTVYKTTDPDHILQVIKGRTCDWQAQEARQQSFPITYVFCFPSITWNTTCHTGSLKWIEPGVFPSFTTQVLSLVTDGIRWPKTYGASAWSITRDFTVKMPSQLHPGPFIYSNSLQGKTHKPQYSTKMWLSPCTFSPWSKMSSKSMAFYSEDGESAPWVKTKHDGLPEVSHWREHKTYSQRKFKVKEAFR